MFQTLILFHDCSMTEDESYKKCNGFCHFVKSIGSYEGTAYKYKIRFVMQPLQIHR
jgi:hypothetical protein